MKLKLYKEFLNEDTKTWDDETDWADIEDIEDEEYDKSINLSDKLLRFIESHGCVVCQMILSINDEQGWKLDVSKPGFMVLSGQIVKVGRLIKKLIKISDEFGIGQFNITQRDIEKFIYEYNKFVSGDDDTVLDNYVAINIRRWKPSNGPTIQSYPVERIDYPAGNPPMRVDKATRKVFGRYEREIGALNRYMNDNPEIIEQLKGLGHEPTTRMTDNVEQNLFFFNKEKDIVKFIEDVKGLGDYPE